MKRVLLLAGDLNITYDTDELLYLDHTVQGVGDEHQRLCGKSKVLVECLSDLVEIQTVKTSRYDSRNCSERFLDQVFWALPQ